MRPRLSINPFFNEFLYNVIYASTTEQKKEIPSKYAKKMKTHTAAKIFANKSFLEEKLDVLTALGQRWVLVVFDKKKNNVEHFNQMFEEAKDSERADLVRIAVRRGMYLMADRHFAFFQGLMADQTNHGIYAQNLLLDKAGYHLHKWKKKIKAGETEIAKSHAEIAPYLVETIMNTQINLEYIEGTLGITKNDFKVLCYLYIRHHVYVKYEELMQRFSGNLTNNKITGCLRRLHIAHMVQRPPVSNTKEYQITAVGIKAVTQFWRQILKANEIQ